MKGESTRMKPFLLSILAVFLLFVPNAAAHTLLDATNPEDGSTVTTELQTISLTYSGKIEEGSTFKVLASDGTEMTIDSTTVKDGMLTGQLSAPLPNDTYKVEWNSISQDGHPLTGTFSFTVDAPVAEAVEGTEVTEEPVVAPTTQDTDPVDEEKSSTTPLLIVGGILIVLILVSIFTLAKRKKTK